MWLFLLPLLLFIPWHPEPQKIQFLGFGVVAMLAILVFGKKRQAEGLQWGWISMAWVALAVWSLIRLSWSREFASLYTLQDLVILAFLWVWPQRKTSSWLPWVLLGASAVSFTLQQFMGEIWWYQFGPFNQENQAQLFQFAMLFGGLLLWPKPTWRWLGLGIPLLSIGLSGAKAVQLAILVTLLAFVVFYGVGRKKWGNLFQWIWVSVFVAFVGLGIPLWLASAQPLSANPSMLSRQDIWWAAKEMLTHGAGFMGVGTGEFGAIAGNYMPDRWSAYWMHLSAPNGAHNLFLQYAVEWGVIGAVLSLWVYIGSLVGAWRRYQRDAQNQSLVHLSFLVGMLPILALTHAIYGFPSSVLFFVWMTVQGETPVSFFQRKIHWIKIIPVTLFVSLGLATLWSYKQLDAESQVRHIFVQHQIHGMQDVEKIQQSLQSMPNSIAAYYASGLFLSNLDTKSASYYLDRTEELSGLRWPIGERRFEIELIGKSCNSQENLARQIFLKIPHSKPYFQRNESNICYERWQNSFLQQGRSQTTR